jgi:hypothetical protein
MSIFSIFKKKKKVTDNMKAFFEHDTNKHKEVSSHWGEYVMRPKLPPDRIEIH